MHIYMYIKYIYSMCIYVHMYAYSKVFEGSLGGPVG